MVSASDAPSDGEPTYVFNALSARTGGGLTYVRSVLTAVSIRLEPGESMVVLAAPWNEEALRECATPNVSIVACRVGTLAARFAFEQLVLPFRFRRSVLYCPGNMSPLLVPRRSVVVLQNARYFAADRSKQSTRAAKLRFDLERLFSRLSLRRAAAVIAISESLAAQITASKARTRSTVEVLQSGRPVMSSSAARPQLPAKVTNFALLLGNDYPHKRYEDAIEGWALSRQAAQGGYLVVAGVVDTRRRVELSARLSSEKRRQLIFLGGVGVREEVRWLLEFATVLISASELEAHPLTPAEAGACGCPLVLSDIPPHREVAGEHAKYFLPGRIHDIAACIDSVERGDRQSWEWPMTWDDHAASLLLVLRRVLASLK